MVLSGNSPSLVQTLKRALSLDGHFYEYTPNTGRTRRQARTIVLLAALSYGLGNALILVINRAPLWIFLVGVVLVAIAVVAGYYFWTLTIWLIGQQLKRYRLTYSDLLVPIGFAYAPQILNFLTLIPLLGRPIDLGLAAWTLLAIIVAVRQGLDIHTRWAVAIALIGWIPVQTAIGSVQVLLQVLIEATS
ncbi:hypothetical protein H6F67_24650 [Microcoleus sp. FACHB-1515]|nr:hypothetical protein [Microcoleus sp. FACHB-1515]